MYLSNSGDGMVSAIRFLYESDKTLGKNQNLYDFSIEFFFDNLRKLGKNTIVAQLIRRFSAQMV